LLEQQYDIQLLAVRFVDPGHPEERLGPRYRVWIRNNSGAKIVQPLNVTLVASNGLEVSDLQPQAGVQIDSMDPQQVLTLDVRLPFEAMSMGIAEDGSSKPFSNIHVMADSHQHLTETDESNNGVVLTATDVLPVDPTAFSTDQKEVLAGSELTVAGEGFGPEPGHVLVQAGGLELQAEILGWYDLGIRVRVPDLSVAAGVAADLVVVRGDTAVSNSVPVQINPKTLAAN
jgi:hypothetical protein